MLTNQTPPYQSKVTPGFNQTKGGVSSNQGGGGVFTQTGTNRFILIKKSKRKESNINAIIFKKVP